MTQDEIAIVSVAATFREFSAQADETCAKAANWIISAQNCFREMSNIIDAAEHADYLNGLDDRSLVILEELQNLQKQYKDLIK
jgi:hypothetical protein